VRGGPHPASPEGMALAGRGPTVLFVGFQAQGTLGRILQDGASKVRIHGEEVRVRAHMRTLDLYSGHADGPELKAWLAERLPVRRGVFLVHGEDAPLKALQSSLANLDHVPGAIIPDIDDVYDLAGDHAVRIERHGERLPPASAGHRDWHNDYAELLLEIGDAVEAAAGRKAKGVIIRRVRDALRDGTRK
jgi:metallo-beta-lactamase family protein